MTRRTLISVRPSETKRDNTTDWGSVNHRHPRSLSRSLSPSVSPNLADTPSGPKSYWWKGQNDWGRSKLGCDLLWAIARKFTLGPVGQHFHLYREDFHWMAWRRAKITSGLNTSASWKTEEETKNEWKEKKIWGLWRKLRGQWKGQWFDSGAMAEMKQNIICNMS